MIFMIIADTHLHSAYSGDSETPMEEMVQEGIRRRLQKIYFTDHIDYDYPICPDGLLFEFDVDTYLLEIEHLQEKYADKIQIGKGLELGLKKSIFPRLENLLSGREFDYIIGSSHIVIDRDPYYPDYWEGISVHTGLMRYFQSILDNIAGFSDFDTYGHIDYIVRYIPDVRAKKAPLSDFYTYEKYADILDAILIALIKADKALEINTAGFKYGIGHPNPHEDVIRRYLELGGKLITIGSDGHQPAHMAYDFAKTRELLLSLGIREYAVFEKRKPVLLPL